MMRRLPCFPLQASLGTRCFRADSLGTGWRQRKPGTLAWGCQIRLDPIIQLMDTVLQTSRLKIGTISLKLLKFTNLSGSLSINSSLSWYLVHVSKEGGSSKSAQNDCWCHWKSWVARSREWGFMKPWLWCGMNIPYFRARCWKAPDCEKHLYPLVSLFGALLYLSLISGGYVRGVGWHVETHLTCCKARASVSDRPRCCRGVLQLGWWGFTEDEQH